MHRVREQQFDPALDEDELQALEDEERGLYEDDAASRHVDDDRDEEEETTSEAADVVGRGEDPFAHLTQDDVGETGRYLVRAVGPFSHIGDIANAGISWENDCIEWDVRQLARETQGAPCDDGDPDPRDLSQQDKRSVNLTSSQGMHLSMTFCHSNRQILEGWIIICDAVPIFRNGIQYHVERGHNVRRLDICKKVTHLVTQYTSDATRWSLTIDVSSIQQ